MENNNPNAVFRIALIIILFITASVFIVGCTPHKRLARLIKNNPELLTVTDTVKFTDTIHFQTERVYRDSIFLISDARRDTVIIKEKNLTVRTFVNGETIYVDGECDTDTITIIKEHAVPYPVVEYKEKESNFITILIVIISILWLTLIAAYFFIKNHSRSS